MEKKQNFRVSVCFSKSIHISIYDRVIFSMDDHIISLDQFEVMFIWLVVCLPLWKMMDFVSWDDDYSIPNWMENHNPAMFQSPPTSV